MIRHSLPRRQRCVRIHRDYRLRTVQGIAYSMKGDDTHALHAFDAALHLSPQYLPALQAEAELLTRRQDPRAASVLETLVRLRPGDGTAREMLALAQARAGDCPAAIANFRATETALATHAASLLHYGVCLFSQNDPAAAVPVFQQLSTLQPANNDARYDLALAQMRAGQNKAATATFEPLLQRTPDVDTLTLAADAFEADGDTPRAVALLRQAIVSDPTQTDAYLRFAKLCLVHQSYDAGIHMVTAGIARLPRDPSLHLARGLLYGELAQYDKAEDDFRVAESLDPRHGSGSYGVGLMQVQSGHYQQALDTARSELRAHPEDPQLHFLLARILIESGAAPGTPDFSEATNSALQAVHARPGMVAAQDLLADIYMRTGQTQLAIDHCRAALAIDPSDHSATYRLMMASRKIGDKAAVQDLAKRLSELLQQSRTDESGRMRFRIVDGDAPASATAPVPDAGPAGSPH